MLLILMTILAVFLSMVAHAAPFMYCSEQNIEVADGAIRLARQWDAVFADRFDDGIGAWAVDLGAMSILLYAVREREMVLDIFERLCGARMTLTYLRVGGVRYDFTDECAAACRDLIKLMPERLGEYERILNKNRVWKDRNIGVGVISA